MLLPFFKQNAEFQLGHPKPNNDFETAKIVNCLVTKIKKNQNPKNMEMNYFHQPSYSSTKMEFSDRNIQNINFSRQLFL